VPPPRHGKAHTLKIRVRLFYDPGDPPEPCCDECDAPGHDRRDCLMEQAQDAAEARAEDEWEDRMFDRWN
jgi:hypothetical protein